MSFLKANGGQNIVGKNDWPEYVEEQSEIYEKEEIDRLFAACNDQNVCTSNSSL
jgi:hypothetical protein